MDKAGKLYIVSTPIGNLEDITLRALKVLGEVDLIAAEDTRHSRKLLAHYNIHTPLCAYYQHNRLTQGEKLLRDLLAGKNIALVSDAGTPGISDPGAQLVEIAVREGISPIIVPGPCAAIAALAVSGLPSARFLFEGYLPHRGAQRRKRLEELIKEEKTLIFYLSPHRLAEELTDIYQVMGERAAVLAREVTKVFEEFTREPLSVLATLAKEQPSRGEYTLILAGQISQPETRSEAELSQMLQRLISQEGLSKKEAVASLAKKLDLPKKDIYKIGEKLCLP